MKNFIKYGLFAALAAIFFSLITYVTGLNRQEWFSYVGFISILIPIYFISTGIKVKRDRELQGFISYGKAFNEGMIISFIQSLIYSAYSYVYFLFIDPGIIDFQKQKTIEKWQEQGMDEAQIEKMLGFSEMWMNPTAFTITSFFVTILVGIVISLIAAAILKKINPEEIS